MPYTAPVQMDTYSRAMARLYNENDIIGTPFGGQMFFGGGNGFAGSTYWEPDAEVFEYDISRGKVDLAPMILRGTNAEDFDDNKGVQIEKWSNFARVYPLIEDFGDITSKQIAKRVKGEGAYQKMSKALRARMLIREVHKITMQKAYRTMEYLSWYVLRFAQMPVLLGATSSDLLYNFHRKSNHSITPAVAWSTASTDIMGDLDTGWVRIQQDAHVNADILLCGTTAVESIVNNTAVQAFADNRRYYHNAIEAPLVDPGLQNLVKNGFGYRGQVTTPKGRKFHMFTYENFYNSTAGSLTEYLPAADALMMSRNFIGDRHFGPDDKMPPSVEEIADYNNVVGVDIEQPRSGLILPNGVVTPKFDPRWFSFSLKRHEKTWKAKTEVAPVFVPVNVDSTVRFITS